MWLVTGVPPASLDSPTGVFYFVILCLRNFVFLFFGFAFGALVVVSGTVLPFCVGCLVAVFWCLVVEFWLCSGLITVLQQL